MTVTLADAIIKVRTDLSGLSGDLIKGTEKAAAEAGVIAGKAFGGSMSKNMVLGSVAATVGVGAIFASAVKSAGSFEASMVKLTATAGETGTMVRGNLRIVSDGILQLAGATGTTTKQLADGMYTVESAGFHGAAGLTVLKAAAQGARAEQANLSTVTNAVTSAMISYHLPADQATTITNQMITATSRGKLTFEQLAGSLATVLPLASSLGLSFAEVTGAEATMTSHGESADLATQHLAYTIRSIAAPNMQAQKEMQRMGLSSVDLAQHLGERGLTGTLKIMTDAVMAHMGPAGLVLTTTMQQSAQATADTKRMFDALPPAIKTVAKQFLDGTISAGDWRAALKEMPVDQANLARQFATTANASRGFNDLIKAGGPDARTYTDIVKRMTGGVDGLQTTLMLTGPNMSAFSDNVAAVGAAGKTAGSNIEGWSAVQGTFNFKLSAMKGHLEAAKVALGEGLLPVLGHVVTAISAILGPLATWVAGDKTASEVILALVGSLGAFVIVGYAVAKVIEITKVAFLALRLNVVASGVAWVAHTVAIGAHNVALGISNGLRLLSTSYIATWIGVKAIELGQWVASTAATIASNVALAAHAVVMGAVRLGTLAWTGAQWLLNVALDANPIGLIVLLIAGLIAIIVVIATKTTWFQTAWQVCWTGIKDAAMWVWNNFLYPTFVGFQFWLHAMISNAEAMWHGVTSAWNNMTGWISDKWTWLRVNVFERISDIITNTVPNAFRDGVSAIGRFWDGLIEKAKAPIRFVIMTVLENGLLGAFRWIASKFGIDSNLHVGLPSGFAAGGRIPGTPSNADNMLAMVATGEHIMPTARTARWLPVLESIRLHDRLPMYPGDLSGLGIRGYADGGVVGALESLGSGLWDLFTDPAKLIRRVVGGIVDSVPGAGMVRDAAVGAGHKLLDGLIGWVKHIGGTGSLGAAGAFIRSQAGKPYGWAMAGPDAYDCSGIVSAVFNVLHGRNPYSHTFSTSNEAGFFPLGGIGGALTAGWTNPGETGVGGGPNGVGHTAGVLAGFGPFESTGSGGVHMGGGVTPLDAFAHIGHYARGGLVPGLPGAPQLAVVHGGERVLPPNADRELAALLERLIGAVERVAPGVGREINRTGASIVTLARAT